MKTIILSMALLLACMATNAKTRVHRNTTTKYYFVAKTADGMKIHASGHYRRILKNGKVAWKWIKAGTVTLHCS